MHTFESAIIRKQLFNWETVILKIHFCVFLGYYNNIIKSIEVIFDKKFDRRGGLGSGIQLNFKSS